MMDATEVPGMEPATPVTSAPTRVVLPLELAPTVLEFAAYLFWVVEALPVLTTPIWSRVQSPLFQITTASTLFAKPVQAFAGYVLILPHSR